MSNLTRAIPRCECADPGCPQHKGESECKRVNHVEVLFRVDMDDRTGTRFCGRCADDAMESGLFRGRK